MLVLPVHGVSGAHHHHLDHHLGKCVTTEKTYKQGLLRMPPHLIPVVANCYGVPLLHQLLSQMQANEGVASTYKQAEAIRERACIS